MTRLRQVGQGRRLIGDLPRDGARVRYPAAVRRRLAAEQVDDLVRVIAATTNGLRVTDRRQRDGMVALTEAWLRQRYRHRPWLDRKGTLA
jgi:hypothetical protein